MNKSKFYIIIIVILLLANIVLIGIMVFPKNYKGSKRGSRGGPKKAIVEKLDLSTDQAAAYQVLIDEHKKSIKAKDKEISDIKLVLYQQLLTENESQVDSLMNEINTVQKEIELKRYEHFRAIKSLCTEDQMDEFGELVGDIGKLFNRKKRR